MDGWFPAGVQSADYGATGILIDGVVYVLDGQPPLAKSNGWGDMSWLRR